MPFFFLESKPRHGAIAFCFLMSNLHDGTMIYSDSWACTCIFHRHGHPGGTLYSVGGDSYAIQFCLVEAEMDTGSETRFNS